jgi:prepilin-type N-terminal cleavage/methylation domain-containing protein
MKTEHEMRIADCGLRIGKNHAAPFAGSFRAPHPALRNRNAFTLIELLVVMGIIGVLAAMLLAVVSGVKKKQYVYNIRAEMAQLETAIERYKAAYGVYPPDNHLDSTNRNLVNPLFYELTGTTNIGSSAAPMYQSLDGRPPTLTGGTVGDVNGAFGLGGFVNCSKPAAGEDVVLARNFLPDLRPKQIWPKFTNNSVGVNLLIGSVGGPDVNYQPLGQPDLNPWRYNSSSPTNNPGSYDLWIQLVIGGKTNLICNWSKSVQINNPLP